MINLNENELLFRCSCYSPDHHAFLVYEPSNSRGNNLKGEDDDWYLTTRLSQFPFWKRALKAFLYIFCPSRIKYGMYSELVLRTQDMHDLVEFILKHTEKTRQK